MEKVAILKLVAQLPNGSVGVGKTRNNLGNAEYCMTRI